MRHLCFVFSSILFGFLVSNTKAEIVLFTERASFDAAFPGLPLEDFEDISGSVDDGVHIFRGLVNSETDEGPIVPGDIENGVSISTVDDISDQLLLLTPDFSSSLQGNVMGPNLATDGSKLEFNPPITAIGFDLLSLNTTGTADIRFMNGEKILALVAFEFLEKGKFQGAATSGDDEITSISVVNEDGTGGTGAILDFVDNIAFGSPKRFLRGDMNCDGVVSLLDVNPFVEAIINGEFDAKADINEDGVVDLLDVDPFVALLKGG